MQRVRRLLGLGILLAAATLLRTTPAGAAALPIAQCTTSSGVIVAVDFGHWGGPVLRSCGSTPTTGYQLINQGGWHTHGTVRDGAGFICTIAYSGYQGGAAFPSSSCINTPPASAYWSYWHADPGQSSWVFSQRGASDANPQPGSVDAWEFGAGNSPGFSPDQARALNGTPVGPPTTSPAPSGGGGPAPSTGAPGSPSGGAGAGNGSAGHGGAGSGAGGTPGAASSGTTGGGGAAGTSSTPAGTRTAQSAAGSAHPDSTARVPSSAARPSGNASGQPAPGGSAAVVDAQPAASIHHGSGSFVPELVAGLLVLLLGGASGVRAWRRRQYAG
jgi:hypothetical protein